VSQLGSIKRYDEHPDGGMREDEDGVWVFIDDHARAVTALLPYRDELMKIAEDVGEPNDPFAAWEVIDALKVENERLREAMKQIAEMANWQIGVPTDTEAANEHARIAHTMAETARAVAFTGGPDAN
jgi:hypothetical protein